VSYKFTGANLDANLYTQMSPSFGSKEFNSIVGKDVGVSFLQQDEIKFSSKKRKQKVNLIFYYHKSVRHIYQVLLQRFVMSGKDRGWREMN
jgi:hypothetical protein